MADSRLVVSTDGAIEVTPEMLEAGRAAFLKWFELDEHQESLVELPPDSSIASLMVASFRSMAAAIPVSFMN